MRAVAIPMADPHLELHRLPDPGFLIQGFLIQGPRRTRISSSCPRVLDRLRRLPVQITKTKNQVVRPLRAAHGDREDCEPARFFRCG